MRRLVPWMFAVVPAVTVVVGVGCSSSSPSTPTSISVTSYDQSCVTADDCAPVHDGDPCQACNCNDAFVNRSDLARFNAAESDARKTCAPLPLCNASCVVLTPACVASKCVVASNAPTTDSGSPDDNTSTLGSCTVDTDCKKTNPDICNICPAGETNLVCHTGSCECACQAPDAG